jgi:hypothetical protein
MSAERNEPRFPIQRGLKSEVVGRLGEHVDEEFLLQGADQTGQLVEWVVRPTGDNSFNITVPEGHELGDPDAWENITILTQRVVSRGAADSCGCDGNQCGCQGSNCGSNSHLMRGQIRLLPSDADPAARALEDEIGLKRG